MNQIEKGRFWGVSAAIVILAAGIFSGFYEHFPKPGWVDAGMYTGYIVNPKLYTSYPLVAHNYQGSRLGFLVPLAVFARLFGDSCGREVFAYALYIASALSLTLIAFFALGRSWLSIVFSSLVIASPLLASSVTYGGADGPAAAFTLVAIALFAMATRLESRAGRGLLALSSGLVAGLAISSHVFSALGLGAALGYFVFVSISEPRVRVLFAYFIVGFAGCLGGLTILGYKIGLDRFYLLFSFPWINQSFRGSGYSFEQPKDEWISQFQLWLPLYATAALALCLIVYRRLTGSRLLLSELYGIFILIATSSFFIGFDNLGGGNLLATPAYLNLVFPAVFFGLVLAYSGNKLLGSEQKRLAVASRIAVLGLLLMNLSVQFASPHIRSLLSEAVDTRDLYQSQIAFVREIEREQLMNPKIRFVYLAADPESRDERIYSDYFGGARRSFDYIDSIASLFLWDRSTAARIVGDIGNFQMHIDRADRTSLVILARNRAELLRIQAALKSATGGEIEEPVCRLAGSYPWCFAELLPG